MKELILTIVFIFCICSCNNPIGNETDEIIEKDSVVVTLSFFGNVDADYETNNNDIYYGCLFTLNQNDTIVGDGYLGVNTTRDIKVEMGTVIKAEYNVTTYHRLNVPSDFVHTWHYNSYEVLSEADNYFEINPDYWNDK
ncbi:MAG: hypothetical protein KJN62_01460 [Deltaproteobacteria bacterium]|nr:hypothetical protein [Deltaproteobacteria bacterium]